MLDSCYAVERDYRTIARAEGKTIDAVYQSISRIRKALIYVFNVRWRRSRLRWTKPRDINLNFWICSAPLWDDRLDAESRAQLETLLSQDDFAAVDLLTSYSRLHLDLEWLVSSKAAQNKALSSVGKLRAAQKVKVRRHLDRRTMGFAGIAAALLLSAFYVWFSAPSGHQHLVRPPLPLGEVVRLENAAPAVRPPSNRVMQSWKDKPSRSRQGSHN